MSSRPRHAFFRRFAWRTTFWFATLLLVAILAAFGGLYMGLKNSLLRDVEELLDDDMRDIVLPLSEAGRSEQALRDELQRRVSGRFGGGLFYRLYDSDGRELWTEPQEFAGRIKVPTEILTADTSARTWRRPFTVQSPQHINYLCRASRVTRDQGRQMCVVGLSLADYELRLEKYIWLLVGIGTLVEVLGGAACYLIVQRPLWVVNEMAAQAREITARELHRRLPEPDSGDELEGLSRTLNAMLARLDESVQRLSQFTGDAAHELRGPLTRMRMAAEVALQSNRQPEELRETLIEVTEQAGEMGRLMNNLLFLARQDSGAVEQYQPVDAAGIIEETFNIFEAVAEERGVTLHTGEVMAGEILGSRQRLLEALGNLVENATRYTNSGGRIVLSGQPVNGTYHFRVHDTGCGIAAEHLPKIFDRFYRVDAARNRADGGAGLGLSIVWAIAHAHGGTVEVVSQVGKGSDFTLVLPLKSTPPQG